ncbi:pyrroline-5-carboxylate reductase [uncultured Methanofollis sp.]|uniref:pyrroline-5-carboxylate reductase family protein n=1 Tax=uncultured Methanofollis sp. TaxID=262500 RepID=UPI00260DA4DC|nr:pyrroline-5-carboxylate reductase [uncultured Methanofollis sp.]
MAQIGIIGTGSMGGMLVRSFVGSGAVRPDAIVASNRTAAKRRALAAETGIRCGRDNREVAGGADVVFLCVRPSEVRGVLCELRDELSPEKVLVSIAAGVLLEDLQAWTEARVVRVIPALTSEVLKGASLVAFGERATEEDRETVLALLNAIGRAVEVEERDIEALTLLTSCGPAFVAALMEEMAAAAVRQGGVRPDLAKLLVKETLMGTAGLIEESDFGRLIARVATPGGVTEKGVAVIRERGPGMFDGMMRAALGKKE